MNDPNMRLPFLAMLVLAITASGAVTDTATEQVVRGFQRNNTSTLRYLLYLPTAYATSEAAFPLLLFLHGGGESGSDIEQVKRHGPPRMIEEGHSFPMIVVSPQNPELKGFWDEDLLAELLDDLETRLRVDRKRIYLTGLSRGAYGAWRLAMEHPDRFAALVPISGAAPAPYGNWLKDMPIWVFHGAKDPVIPVAESEDIVRTIRNSGRTIHFTVYPEAGHDAWTQAYADPALWSWLLEQHK